MITGLENGVWQLKRQRLCMCASVPHLTLIQGKPCHEETLQSGWPEGTASDTHADTDTRGGKGDEAGIQD